MKVPPLPPLQQQQGFLSSVTQILRSMKLGTHQCGSAKFTSVRLKSVLIPACSHQIPNIWERIVYSGTAHWLTTFMLPCTCTDKSGHQNARYKQSLEQFAGSSQACQLQNPPITSQLVLQEPCCRLQLALGVQPSPQDLGTLRASSASTSLTYRH